jgi:hypothetical protein
VQALLTTILAFMLALSLGLGSAWYMIAEGSPLTTGQIGPWSVWYSAGNPEPDPYTKAYQARTGRLPITSTNGLYYYARTDQAGDPLNSECDYLVDGQPINAAWWSFAVYDERGQLIPNKANRHSFNRTDIVRRANGSFRIVLAPNARPGNWLPTGDSGSVQLVLRIYGPRNFNATVKGRQLEHRLPSIVKVRCK